jgi:hypothetical protein
MAKKIFLGLTTFLLFGFTFFGISEIYKKQKESEIENVSELKAKYEAELKAKYEKELSVKAQEIEKLKEEKESQRAVEEKLAIPKQEINHYALMIFGFGSNGSVSIDHIDFPDSKSCSSASIALMVKGSELMLEQQRMNRYFSLNPDCVEIRR